MHIDFRKALTAFGPFLGLAFVYLVSMVLRDRGVRYARKFWEERGGLPSTRFGRMRDPFLSSDQKNRIQQAVLQRFGIRLMALDEEYEYPALADQKIKDSFREIKEFLRRSEGCALVEKQGAEYGFARNLCGSRVIFVAQAVSGIVLCGFKGTWPHWRFSGGCWVNAALLALWVPFAWLVLPGMLALSADTYAGRAWVTFLGLTETMSKKPNSGVNSTGSRQRASSE